MKTHRTAWQIRTTFALMTLALVLAWSANIAHADESASSLSIAPTGQIIVKGARVLAVNGSTIIAETGWGAAKISFAVQTSGSTRFVPEIGSAQALSAIRPGHTVSFSGSMVGSMARPTVIATVVKDTELVQESTSIVGTVRSVDENNSTFVLSSAGSDVTVRVPTGTLMSRDGNYAEVSDIQVGDAGKATGTLDIATNTLLASRVSVVTKAEESIESPEIKKEGVLSSLISWLKSSRGILSVRDR